MRVDGLAQEDDVVWRRGGVDGRETWHGRCVSFCSEDGSMEDGGVGRCRMRSGAHCECSGPVCVTQSRYVARLGHPALDVRLWCDVCLVLGSYIRYPFIKGI
jgi:hypothetical protein